MSVGSPAATLPPSHLGNNYRKRKALKIEIHYRIVSELTCIVYLYFTPMEFCGSYYSRFGVGSVCIPT